MAIDEVKVSTFSYNRDEIRALGAEGAKKAIENGDITLPPAGTKLYLHDVNWTENGAKGHIKWISTVSQSATAYTDILNDYLPGASYVDSLYKTNPQIGTIVSFRDAGSTSVKLLLNAGKNPIGGGSGFGCEIKEITFDKTFTDTVTEL